MSAGAIVSTPSEIDSPAEMWANQLAFRANTSTHRRYMRTFTCIAARCVIPRDLSISDMDIFGFDAFVVAIESNTTVWVSAGVEARLHA